MILILLMCASFTISNGFDFVENSHMRFSRALPSTKFCPANSYCMPLSSCPILKDIISSNCVNNNRLGSLGCGYQGSGLVCCPQSHESSSISNDKFVDGNACGQSAIQGHDYDGIGAYPWVARIGFRNVQTGELKFPCAGSILNKRVILTAAHCALAKADNYKLLSVRIGEWMSNSDIDCGDEFCGLPVQDIAISHVIVHPGYEKHTYKNNIALIVTRSPFNFTVTPPRQQALHLPIVNLRKCVNIYGRSISITEEHVCAGGELGNDACSGFGGAPLIVTHGEHSYQVGILSFGSEQCGAKGVPSVYTNIKKYVTWIKENMPILYNN